MNCRHCGTPLQHTFLDLGSAPPSNSYLTIETFHEPEQWLPLHLLVCENCWLVQTDDFAKADTFFNQDYAYFSSFSTTWLKHAEKYMHLVTDRFSLGKESTVIEIAANDGYLLQFFQKAAIPCVGIEPASGTAKAARKKGLTVIEEFFGESLARSLLQKGMAADLLIANNVLAHVPDINGFISGFTTLLKPGGVATFEFPHLLSLVQENQFDTVYHEHYSYLSFTAVQKIFNNNGLHIFDVEKLSTHGGSLRIYSQHINTKTHTTTKRIHTLLLEEKAAGILKIAFYSNFQNRAEQVKNNLLDFLLHAKNHNLTVAAYGAAAKGNTLLNFAGVRPDLLRFVVDKNPAKQGKFMPGSRIPIVDETHLQQKKPDRVLILPWNLQDEIKDQLQYIKAWGGQFVTAVPALELHQ